MRNRAAALAGRGGRRGCADGDMVAVVQRGAGVSVKSPLLHWLEHLRAQGGREAEDATRHGVTPGIFSVAPRSNASSPQLRQSTRAPSPDKSTTGRGHTTSTAWSSYSRDTSALRTPTFSLFLPALPHSSALSRRVPPQHTSATMISIPSLPPPRPRLTPLIQLPKAQSRHRRHETVSIPSPCILPPIPIACEALTCTCHFATLAPPPPHRSLMSDYDVTLVNNKMSEFFVKFKGPTESESRLSLFHSCVGITMWRGNEFAHARIKEALATSPRIAAIRIRS